MSYKKSHFYKFTFSGLCIFILVGFLLTFSVNVNAESLMPIVVDNSNFTLKDTFQNVIYNRFGNDNFWSLDRDGVIIIHHDYNGGFLTCYFPCNLDNPFAGLNWTNPTDSNYSGFNYYTSTVQINVSQSTYASGNNYYKVGYQIYDGSLFLYNVNNNVTVDLYGNTGNYFIYVSGDLPVVNSWNQVSSSNFLVTHFTPVTVPTEGHSQGYMNNIPQFGYPIGMHPTSAPTVPTYTQPTLSNPPTIDTSSVQSVLESIFDLLAWVLQSILSYLLSIINVLIDWFDFMSNLAIWIADFIKQLFVALMDFLYNNFTHLFAPLFNFLTSFFNFLFNTDDQMSIYDLIKEFKGSVETWFNSFWSNSWFSSYWSTFETLISDSFNYFSKIVLFFTSLVALGSDSSGEFAIGTLINNLFLPNPAEVAVLLYANDEFDVFSTTVAIFQSFPVLVNQLLNATPSATIHIPSLIYHGQQIGDFDVDFSWYSTYKVYFDVILNAFLIIGYLYWLFITFGSHLRGHFIDYEPNNPDSNARLFRG